MPENIIKFRKKIYKCQKNITKFEETKCQKNIAKFEEKKTKNARKILLNSENKIIKKCQKNIIKF